MQDDNFPDSTSERGLRFAMLRFFHNCQACKDVPTQIQSQNTTRDHEIVQERLLLPQVQSNVQVNRYVCPSMGSVV